MDCYIVRVYRHIKRNSGQADEIAGLVERVGTQDSGKPFSTYTGLVDAIRAEFQAQPTEEQEQESVLADGAQKIRSIRGR